MEEADRRVGAQICALRERSQLAHRVPGTETDEERFRPVVHSVDDELRRAELARRTSRQVGFTSPAVQRRVGNEDDGKQRTDAHQDTQLRSSLDSARAGPDLGQPYENEGGGN